MRQSRAGSSSTVFRNDNDSDLVALEHQFDGQTDVDFTHAYDGSGRLTATATDVSGWLWSANSVSWTRDYSSYIDLDTDQISGWTGHEAQSGFVYDDNGNLTNTPYRYMPHDSMNRMTAIAGTLQETTSGGGWDQTSASSGSSAFVYDPDGRRIVRTSTLYDNLRFAHAGDMEIADVNDQGGSGIVGRIMRRYVPGASVDDRVVMITTNTATCSSLNGSVPYSGNPCASSGYEYYHADRQGNVIAMVNASGAFTAWYIYTPYGVEEPYNASSNPYRYTGRRLEPEWGIFHYRARYYDPALGRFLETDPVLYADQMNLYAYVGNNPLNATDPTGRQSAPNNGLIATDDDASSIILSAADDPASAGMVYGVDDAAISADVAVQIRTGTTSAVRGEDVNGALTEIGTIDGEFTVIVTIDTTDTVTIDGTNSETGEPMNSYQLSDTEIFVHELGHVSYALEHGTLEGSNDRAVDFENRYRSNNENPFERESHEGANAVIRTGE